MATEGDGGARGAPDGWRRVYDVFGYVGGAILAIMTAAVFVQVVLRYLGQVGIDGLEEVPRYLFVWLVMIGAASAMQRSEHTVLDYFVNRMAPRVRSLVIAFTNLVGIGVFLYLIKLSIVLVPNAQLQTSAGLNLPLGYVFIAVPIGSALIILPMVRAAYRALRDAWPRHS